MKKIVLLILISFSIQLLFAQKEVAIYWDASYSMKDRETNRELQFLDNYFKKYSEANVHLSMFSNDILAKSNYTIVNGDWSALKNELLNTVYDGATSYSKLFKDDVEEYLLFTDGIENMDKLNAPKDKPIHIITSVQQSNVIRLKLVSDLSKGRFIYLNNEPLTEANVNEKSEELVSNVNDGFVTGTVSGVEGLLANVSVVNQNSSAGTATNVEGAYKIEAGEGDILIFSYLGKKTVSVRVGKADIIQITMANINQDLDAVVITAESESEEIVNTGNTMVDKKRLGYDVETISSEDISNQDINLNGVVNGQFTNFELPNNVYNTTDISQYLGRGKNMTILLNQYGLVVIDGVPLAHTESDFGGIPYNHDNILNPDLIESVTYLKGLAATNKYGTLGRNGVLLITTKNFKVDNVADDGKKDIPLGTTDSYSGNAQQMEKLANTSYINALKEANSVNEAFGIYLQQREQFGDDPVFYIDVVDYFRGWQNPLITNRILSNVYEIQFDNAEVLRAVAYQQHSLGLTKEALITLKRIVELEPDQSQSYRDLALGYVYSGNLNEALKLYDNIDKNKGIGNTVLFGIEKTLSNEFKNLVTLHGDKLNTIGINDKYKRPIKYKSRIVFEWNNLDAEFDLNIINPQNRFFTWSHTTAENSQNILQQKQQGYALEEFYLTNDDVGEWKFNMKYYGNKSDDPTYVKITTYNNFGYDNQTKNIKVVRLDKTNIEQTIANLVVN